MGTKNLNSATDLITFSRASSSTFLGSNGLIQTATNNTPRIEYNADGTVKGLLIEEARTNLNTNSSVFSSGWGLTNATASDNVVESPDGMVNAAEYEHTNSISQISKAFTLVTSTTYTVSVFLKANTNTWVRLAGSGLIGAWFDVATGSIGTREVDNVDAKIEPYGNGWYRCSITFVASSTSITLLFGNETANNSTTEATGVTGYIYGAQLEAGAFPTSYIPTTGSTATRAADVASIPVSAFGYNQKAGSIVVDFDTNNSTTSNPHIIDLTDNTNNNRIIIQKIINTTEVHSAVKESNTLYVDIDNGDIASNVSTKVAFGFANNNFASNMTNGSFITDTTGNMPSSITKLNIGSKYNSTNISTGHIKSIKYYPRRLSDTQLQELTT